MSKSKAHDILPGIKSIISDANANQYDRDGLQTAAIKMSVVPDQPDVVIVLTQTGGPPQDRYVPIVEQTIQVYVRADDYNVAQSLLVQVADSIEGNHNKTAGGVNIMDIWSTSSAGPIGRDDQGNDEWVQNYMVRSRYAGS